MLDKFHLLTFSDTSEIYYYQAGIYRPGGEEAIKAFVCQLDPLISVAFFNNILMHVHARSYVERAKIREDPNAIHVLNGYLTLDDGQLHEPDPDVVAFSRIPVEYVPGATCPAFLKFLGEVVTSSDAPVVQELFGFCLVKDYFLHKSALLTGRGRNGKTTLLATLIAMLGRENCAEVELQDIAHDQYQVASLFGKLANVCPDIDAKRPVRSTGKFKALTGGDTIQARHIYKGPFSFTSYAKMLFACNGIPQCEDDSDAYAERWLIISFPNQFIGPNETPGLKYHFQTREELSGILNWAIEGLKRLRQQGQFSYSKTGAEVMDLYKRGSDTVYSFIKDQIVADPLGRISRADLYSAYTAYCEVIERTASVKGELTRGLTRYIPSIKDIRQREWGGIRLRCELDPPYEVRPGDLPQPGELTGLDKYAEEVRAMMCAWCGDDPALPGDPDGLCDGCRACKTYDDERAKGAMQNEMG